MVKEYDGGMSLKKITIVLIGVLMAGGLFFIFFDSSRQQEEPKILSQLEDRGTVNGKREFLFSITNVGGTKATLEFLTRLEYNVSISNLDNQEIPSGEILMEHLDLKEKDTPGRILVLEPNQKIDYRLLISKIPKGNYEINIGSATGYGGIQNLVFTIEN
jgi:hypothetical protein